MGDDLDYNMEMYLDGNKITSMISNYLDNETKEYIFYIEELI